MPELQHATFYAPQCTVMDRGEWTLFIDGAAPNWVAVDERAAWLLRTIMRGGLTFGTLVTQYATAFHIDPGKAWMHVHTYVSEAMRHGMVSLAPIEHIPYRGRADHLMLSSLRECWLHTNNLCNLSCTHCLVSSSPQGEHGLPTAFWKRVIAEAVALGVDRFYITGGEPFTRQDMPELVRTITETHKIELVLLTNATLFTGARAQALDTLNRDLVKFQVSIDGSTPERNDIVRGAGSLEATIAGLKEISRRGFEATITAVALGTNLDDLPNITRLADACGIRSQHLMWLHKRGRVATSAPDIFPTNEQLIDAVRAVKRTADAVGVVLDNATSFELRANAPAGVKFDLGNAGWQSLCIYADGQVYPSAALANHTPLQCGQLNGVGLEELWRTSPVLQKIRAASVMHKDGVQEHPLRFMTGGGDIEHSYFYSGSFTGDDPYQSLYESLLLDAMDVLARQKKSLLNTRAGYDVPRIYHAMGDGAVVCGTTEIGTEDVGVAFLHSNCVLSFDVEKPRKIVQAFYGQAAEQPQAELCCPTKYDDSDIAHIPQEVLDRFYGCGSPVTSAHPQGGETYVDVGSGAGIDCFIAAKHVGPTGHVIGVDMTDQMLAVARASAHKVSEALGYDVVEFRQGFLEEIPVETQRAHIVTSNCVINLSPDKPKVFAELWRILRDHGRVVIADIVSDREVPPRLKVNEQLWGECIVGALTEEQFFIMLEQAGFYGLSVMQKTFWKEIEGYQFYSVTVQGFKFEKTAGCTWVGQSAIYHGPFKVTTDEEGHVFPRHVPIAVCTDTAAKLRQPPYQGWFTVLESGADAQQQNMVMAPVRDEGVCCAPDAGATGTTCC
jgi:7,8-dihydro-6-hydroxymethylpterin dimethyltransferase